MLLHDPIPPFAPAPWLANRHLQTVLGTALRRPRPLDGVRRKRIDLFDGDFLDVDVAPPEGDAARGAPWVLVLHGLGGSSRAPYARGMAAALVAAGYEACLLNYRGCSGEPNRLPRGYHGGATIDVRAAIAALAAERPGRPFAAVGFSLGANLLMKLLGEAPDRVPAALVAAVAISPPFNYERCMRHLDLPSRTVGFYRRRLLRTLKRQAATQLAATGEHGRGRIERLVRARSFAEFDGRHTAPLYGFADAASYWRHVSGVRFLAAVRRPMLMLAAADDPFFPRDYVPARIIAANPCLRLVLTDRGGHCGFVTGLAGRTPSWAEAATIRYLAGVFPAG